MADEPFVYKRWDDGFVVRRMTLEDVKIVQKWYSGLCPTSCDLDIVMDICEPDGDHFYIGELNGEVIASCGKVPVDKDIIYGSYLYVEEKYRGFGYANRIMFEVAGKYDGDRIVCQDSHDELEAMNVRRGYKTAFRLNLYKGPAPSDMHKNGARSDARFQQMTPDLLDELIVYDDRCFVRPGSEFRKRLLERWTSIEGGKTVVALDSDHRIVGFGCRRPAFEEGNHLIGPLYADSFDIARDLVYQLSNDIPDTKIWINICEPLEEAGRLVKELGLKVNIHMIRMHANGDPKELNRRVFAITSIDVCGF